MGWFSSTDKVVDDVLDKDNGLLTQFGSWIGRMELTEEDALIANAKTVSSVQDHVVDTLSENTERSKSRRSIAGWIVKTYIISLVFAMFVWKFDPEWSEFILKALSGLAIGGAFTAVVVFHFGSYGLARIKQKK